MSAIESELAIYFSSLEPNEKSWLLNKICGMRKDRLKTLAREVDKRKKLSRDARAESRIFCRILEPSILQMPRDVLHMQKLHGDMTRGEIDMIFDDLKSMGHPEAISNMILSMSDRQEHAKYLSAAYKNARNLSKDQRMGCLLGFLRGGNRLNEVFSRKCPKNETRASKALKMGNEVEKAAESLKEMTRFGDKVRHLYEESTSAREALCSLQNPHTELGAALARANESNYRKAINVLQDV